MLIYVEISSSYYPMHSFALALRRARIWRRNEAPISRNALCRKYHRNLSSQNRLKRKIKPDTINYILGPNTLPWYFSVVFKSQSSSGAVKLNKSITRFAPQFPSFSRFFRVSVFGHTNKRIKFLSFNTLEWYSKFLLLSPHFLIHTRG